MEISKKVRFRGYRTSDRIGGDKKTIQFKSIGFDSDFDMLELKISGYAEDINRLLKNYGISDDGDPIEVVLRKVEKKT